ncbi:MAG: LysR substrate-binding domain-containing protein [Pseudomonadota bacterium]
MADHAGVSNDWRLRDDAIRFAEEGCDFWVRIGPVPEGTPLVRELARVERLVVATPGRLARYATGAPEALPWMTLPWLTLPCLTLGPFEGNRIVLFDEAGNEHGFSVRPKLASDTILAIHQAVLRGAGGPTLPKWSVGAELEAGVLIDVFAHLRARSLPVNLAMWPGTKRPACVDAFCQALEKWCREAFAG